MMNRFMNSAVDVPPTFLYFAVNVFEPAVTVCVYPIVPFTPFKPSGALAAQSSLAAVVVAPEIAMLINPLFPKLPVSLPNMPINTNTLVPVVNVTVGPTVDKSV
jgi:hypothetical protein